MSVPARWSSARLLANVAKQDAYSAVCPAAPGRWRARLKKAPSKSISMSFTTSCVFLYAPACGWQTAKNGWMKKVPILDKRKNKYWLIIKKDYSPGRSTAVPTNDKIHQVRHDDQWTKGSHVRSSSYFRCSEILMRSS